MTGRYQAYSEYKDSGVEWLQRVPCHWELRKSKYIFTRVQRSIRSNDGVITAFRDGQVTLRANRRTEGFTNSLKEIGYQGVRKGDLLVHSMDGFAGAIGISDSDGKCSPVCSVCVPKETKIVHMPYYGYLVRQLAVTDYIISLAKGIRERSTEFRFNEFAVLELLLPDTEEQHQIAAFLDHETSKIDTLIEKQQKLIALLKEKRQAVISHAVTKGLNPDAPMKDSGVEWLGDVPAHWKILQIKHLSCVKRGASPRPIDDPKYFDEDGEYVWTRIADVTASDVYLTEAPQRLSDLGSSLSVKLQPGSLFLSIAGTVGKPCLTGIKACIHDGFVYFPELKIPSKYLFYIFAAGQAFQGLGKFGTQLNLNTDTVGGIKVGIPETKEISQIITYIDHETDKIDNLIGKAQTSIKLSKERRTAIISAAVTGKIDVRNWQPPPTHKESQ